MLLTSNAKGFYILFYKGVRQRLKAGFFKRGGNVTVLRHRYLPHLILLTTSALAPPVY